MRNLFALMFLSFCITSHIQSIVDSIHVTLTSQCGTLDVGVSGWYNGAVPAYLGHAAWGGYSPYADQVEEIQPGHFEASLYVDTWIPWVDLPHQSTRQITTDAPSY